MRGWKTEIAFTFNATAKHPGSISIRQNKRHCRSKEENTDNLLCDWMWHPALVSLTLRLADLLRALSGCQNQEHTHRSSDKEGFIITEGSQRVQMQKVQQAYRNRKAIWQLFSLAQLFSHCFGSGILSESGFCCKTLGHNFSHLSPLLSHLRLWGLMLTDSCIGLLGHIFNSLCPDWQESY